MKLRYWLAIGLVSFLAGMFLDARPALLNAWLLQPDKNSDSFRFYGVQGTVSEGEIAALTVKGRPVLRDVRWKLKPAWLALLRLSVDVDSGSESQVHVNLARSVFGKLKLSNLTVRGSLKELLGLIGQPNLPIEGQADVDFPLVRLDAGVPVEARGSAEVRNLAWTLAKDPLALGSFTATASTDDKGILVSLDSGAGPLQMQGSVTVARDHTYDLHVQVRPKPDAPPALQTLVSSFGTPDAQGWYQVRKNGTLAPAAPAAASPGT